MQRLVFIILTLVLFYLITDKTTFANDINQESTPPIIDIKPDSFFVSISEGKFITRNIKVLNRGGEPLYIKSITSSCQCGSSRILAGKVEPLGIGKIQLSVNTEGLYDGNNIVEFIVNSTARNSPTQIKFVIDTTAVDTNKTVIEK
ncbi:MAG: DUF1573 domain-containing protein [Candidatus Kapabacteria bacterium]|nr:DUF1573 domain-containing protein [Candidatus Kapabacteria bacterium]